MRHEKIIKRQNELIGSLTTENSFLRDSDIKRKEWLHKAKEQAGYSQSVSFDVVWAETLEMAKKYKLSQTN